MTRIPGMLQAPSRPRLRMCLATLLSALALSLPQISPSVASPPSDGPNSGSVFTNNASVGTEPWMNPENAAGSDNLSSTSLLLPGRSTNYLVATGFGFSIPAVGVIEGITVEIERSSLRGLVADNAIRIVKDGIVGVADRSSAANWPIAEGYIAFGGATDLWGQEWLPADINDMDFGFAITARLGGGSLPDIANIDHARITAYYREKSFLLVGTHPRAVNYPESPGSLGKALIELEAFNGKLYTGYGWSYPGSEPAQAEKTDIMAWSPTTNMFESQLSPNCAPFYNGCFDSEAIFVYRLLGSRIYAPAIDHSDGIEYASGEPWSQSEDPNTVARRAWDMATTSDGSIWLSGSFQGPTGYEAAVWRSTNGGQTFTRSLSTPVGAYCCPSYNGLGVLSGKLYTQAPFEAFSRVWNGTSWTQGPDLLPGGDITQTFWKPLLFKNRLIYRIVFSIYADGYVDWPGDYSHALVPYYWLNQFDGNQVTRLTYNDQDIEAVDVETNGRSLFVLTRARQVLKTTDLVSWQLIGQAPADGVSLGMLDSYLYIGAHLGQLYRYSEPIEAVLLPSDDATVKLNSPDTNFGSAATLQVDASPQENILFKFNVTGITGKRVKTAKLVLCNINGSDNGGDFYQATDNGWTEGTVTWNNAPASVAGPFTTLGSVGQGLCYEIDVKSMLVGDGIYGIRIKSTSGNDAWYSSTEGNRPPILAIEFEF